MNWVAGFNEKLRFFENRQVKIKTVPIINIRQVMEKQVKKIEREITNYIFSYH